MIRVNRFEKFDAVLKPPQRHDNGFLLVDGRIARVGIQEYADAKGGVFRELRLPEDVFDAASLASFRQLPVTNNHPPGMLTAKNAKQYTVGNVGENVRADGEWVVAPLMITDEAAITDAERGRCQLSNGYSCTLDATQDPALTARWGKYDAIQRNIRGNHVALVDAARAGSEARIRLDAGDAVAVTHTQSKEETTMPTDLVTDDGKTPAELQAELAAARGRIAALEATIASAPRRDEKTDDDRRKEVRARVALETQARAILGRHEPLNRLDDDEVRRRVVRVLAPAMRIDAEDAMFVSAAYAALIAVRGRELDVLDGARMIAQGPGHRAAPTIFDRAEDRETARERMEARSRAALVPTHDGQSDGALTDRGSNPTEAKEKKRKRDQAMFKAVK